MSDINTIVSNYKNNLDKKMTDSHTALKEELQASGGSEWKAITVSGTTEIDLSNLNYNEFFIKVSFKYDSTNTFFSTDVSDATTIVKLSAMYHRKIDLTETDLYVYIKCGTYSSTELGGYYYLNNNRLVLNSARYGSSANSSYNNRVTTILYYR